MKASYRGGVLALLLVALYPVCVELAEHIEIIGSQVGMFRLTLAIGVGIGVVGNLVWPPSQKEFDMIVSGMIILAGLGGLVALMSAIARIALQYGGI